MSFMLFQTLCVHVCMCVCEVAGMCGQSQLWVCVLGGGGGKEVAWYCDDEILQYGMYLWSDLFEFFAKSNLFLMLCLK